MIKDYNEVKDDDCITTGLVDYDVITADSSITDEDIRDYHIAKDNINTEIYFIDSQEREWEIKEIEDGTPIFVAREKK